MDHFCYLCRVCHVFLSVRCSLVVTCWDGSLVCDVLFGFLLFSHVVSLVRCGA